MTRIEDVSKSACPKWEWIFDILYLELPVTLRGGKDERFETITFVRRVLASWRYNVSFARMTFFLFVD